MAHRDDRLVDWRGGSLDELVAMLSGPALAASIEVLLTEGRGVRVAGEVHLLAGGVADAFAGGLRGDEALAHLRRLSSTSFRVEPRAPDPETGALDQPGQEEGTLADRPLVSLMRYCEQYVMTCLIEVWRGSDHATIGYRRGEITSTTVDGRDGAERLHEVMTWANGSYRLVLPPLVLSGPARPGQGPASGPHTAHQPSGVVARPAAESWSRDTLSLIPAANEAARRMTVPGMPVDVYDESVPERITDVGVPAVGGDLRPAPQRITDVGMPVGDPTPGQTDGAVAGAENQFDQRGQDGQDRDPGPTPPPERKPARLRMTTPGFVPAHSGGALPASTMAPMSAARRDQAASQARISVRRTAVRRRSLSDLPVALHVVLGLGLGLAVVGAYWVVQSLLLR